MTAPQKARSYWSSSTFERMTDRNVDTEGYRQLHDDLAARGVDLSPEQAGNWAAAGFTAATAREFIDAGFAPDESGSAQTYHAAGLYDGAEAFLERLEDETNELVYRADEIEEAQAEREADFHDQYETDPETGLLKRRPEPPEEPWEDPWAPDPPVDLSAETQAEADYADSWGDIEAARAQEQGERLADAEDARASGSTGDVLDDIDSAIGDAEATSAGWTADDQAAFEREVDASSDGEPNPLYVEPAGPNGADDIWTDDVPTPWPPLNREPTEQELADGMAVQNEDGSTSWSPTNADFDWTSEQEERAAGHPAAQASDYEAPGAQDAWDAEQRDYNEDARSHMGGHPDSDERSAAGVRAELERAQDEHDPHGLRWMAPEDRAAWEHEHYGDDADDYPGRLSPEVEEIARGVEEREAAMDAMEADDEMVGSDAWQARQYEEQWDGRGDAEETARVEEDAAERASYEAEQRAEAEAQDAEDQAAAFEADERELDEREAYAGVDFVGDLKEAQAGLNDNPLPRPPGRSEPDDTPGGADGGDDYSGPFDEGSADGYGQEEPF